ncbi:MAG: type II toxin-antitoxin system RelE/ParE family toxin, partial [Candidatus Saccharimonas sp.]|nr:type II toxin-antitoxin system RelE/ParE family toxin [Planctomycetaceae bacterium]
MKRVIFHPEARGETDEAAEYYAAVSDELRRDFLDEIERLASEVARNPRRF